MKLTTLLLFCFVTLTLSAQTRKGSLYLSGNTALEYLDVDNEAEEFSSLLSRAQDFSGVTATSFRTGYFLTNRLLVGTRINYSDAASVRNHQFAGSNSVFLKPFVRYYFLDLGAKPLSFFGELGFGTIGVGGGDGYETDFHLGVGAELPVAPGILGTINLNYDANAWGLNFTNLNLGLNALTGQLAANGALTPVGVSTLTAVGQVGNVAYGRTSRGGKVDSELRINLSPRVGYFVFDGFLLEAEVILTRDESRFEIGSGFNPTSDFNSSNLEANLRARYYVLRRGPLLPFASLGAGYRRLVESEDNRSDDFVQGIESYFWKAGVGATYFLSPHLAVDLSAEYDRGSVGYTERANSDLTATEKRLNATAALRFFLPTR